MNELFIRNAALKCFSQRARKPIYRRRNFAYYTASGELFADIINEMSKKLKTGSSLTQNDNMFLTFALWSYCDEKGAAGLNSLLKDDTIERWLRTQLGAPAKIITINGMGELAGAMKQSLTDFESLLNAKYNLPGIPN